MIKEITASEVGGFLGRLPDCEFRAWGIYDGEKLAAIFGLTDKGLDAPVVSSDMRGNYPSIKVWRKTLEAFNLIKSLGYDKLYAEGQPKYLIKLGFVRCGEAFKWERLNG